MPYIKDIDGQLWEIDKLKSSNPLVEIVDGVYYLLKSSNPLVEIVDGVYYLKPAKPEPTPERYRCKKHKSECCDDCLGHSDLWFEKVEPTPEKSLIEQLEKIFSEMMKTENTTFKGKGYDKVAASLAYIIQQLKGE
jgi:hypothetical protein